MKHLAFFMATVLAVVSVVLWATDIERAVGQEGIKIPTFLVGSWSGESGLVGPYPKGKTSYTFSEDGKWVNETFSGRVGPGSYMKVTGTVSSVNSDGTEITLSGRYETGRSVGAPVKTILKKVSDEKMTGTGEGGGGAFELAITKNKEAEKKQ